VVAVRILRLRIHGFRGFDSFTLHPQGHAVLVGQPRAGRSDVIEALRRVLSPDATRLPLTEDLDFHNRDTSRQVEIEVVLGHLGEALEQEFFDQLEVWNSEQQELVDLLEEPAELDGGFEWVVRLCYRARWSDDQEQAEHWVDFPKLSDPENEVFQRVPRRTRAALPFATVSADGRPLGLASKATFRALVESTPGKGFPAAVDALEEQLRASASAFSSADQLSAALEATLASARSLLELDDSQPAQDVVRFLPDGGSLAGILRSLGPALDLGPPGHLPVWRHGSTTAATLRIAEVVAMVMGADAVVAIDDFGDKLDSAGARHLATMVLCGCAQGWLSTRVSAVAEAFHSTEIVRLVRDGNGSRRAHQLPPPASRAERTAARHLSLQLLPSMAAKTVAVLEGPHDKAASDALARRRLLERGVPLPAAHGLALVDAAAADGSGGTGAVPKLATLARRFGFHTIAVLDWDRGEDAPGVLSSALAAADAVVRLPEGHAIEKALVVGLDEEVIRDTLRQLEVAYQVRLPSDLHELSGSRLIAAACALIKGKGGLHAQFIELLPPQVEPPLLTKLLETVIQAAADRATGHLQL
jgi:putative ATP-dependent endonuclease of OLD family